MEWIQKLPEGRAWRLTILLRGSEPWELDCRVDGCESRVLGPEPP